MKSHTKFKFLFYLTLILPLINNSSNAQNNGFVAVEDSVKVLIESDKVDIALPDAYTIKKSHADAIENLSLKRKPFKMTSLPFGGIGLSFANVNGQVALMNGGRGSATFNNRFTFGGGGWGMPKGIELESSEEGVYEFFKMGYGGLEFGYILYPGEKIKFGTNLLVGCGVGFKETVPK